MNTYQWILCNEKMPDRDGKYLCVLGQKGREFMMILSYVAECEGWNCFRAPDGAIHASEEVFGVVAWMELPAFP